MMGDWPHDDRFSVQTNLTGLMLIITPLCWQNYLTILLILVFEISLQSPQCAGKTHWSHIIINHFLVQSKLGDHNNYLNHPQVQAKLCDNNINHFPMQAKSWAATTCYLGCHSNHTIQQVTAHSGFFLSNSTVGSGGKSPGRNPHGLEVEFSKGLHIGRFNYSN